VNVPRLTLLETKLVGQVDQDVFDFLLGQGNVGLLSPGRVRLSSTVATVATLGIGRGAGTRRVVIGLSTGLLVLATVTALACPSLSADTTAFVSFPHLTIGIIISSLLRISRNRLRRQSAGTGLGLVVVRVVAPCTRVLERVLLGHL
jgi:hypothetical protein